MNWSLVSCGGSFPFSSWNDPQITLLTFYFFLKLFYHPISFILSEPTINFYFQSTSMFWWETPHFWASPKIRFILLSLALTWTCCKLTFCCTLTQVLLFPKWLVQLELFFTALHSSSPFMLFSPLEYFFPCFLLFQMQLVFRCPVKHSFLLQSLLWPQILLPLIICELF